MHPGRSLLKNSRTLQSDKETWRLGTIIAIYQQSWGELAVSGPKTVFLWYLSLRVHTSEKGNEPNVAEMFKHDILNIYYTLWSLNLIPLLQIPTNDKAQFKNGANFISHFNVGPPMYPPRVYSRLQSHKTHHHKTRAWSQKHFCFTSPWVTMNRNTSFQQPGGFVSMTTGAEIQIFFFFKHLKTPV